MYVEAGACFWCEVAVTEDAVCGDAVLFAKTGDEGVQGDFLGVCAGVSV